MHCASFHFRYLCPLCVLHPHRAQLHSASLCSLLLTRAPCSASPSLPAPALLLIHSPCLASPSSAVLRSASHMCPVLCFTLLPCAHRLHLPHAPSLASPCSTVRCFASLTCTVTHFTLLACSALHLSLVPLLLALSLPAPACISHRPVLHFPLLRCARSAAHLSLAPRLTPPCSAVLLCSASHTCSLPHSTLLRGAASLCSSHTHHASLHPARLCSSLLHTLAPCLPSPCSAVLLLFASSTHTVPRFTLPRSAPLCFTHMPIHSTWLISALRHISLSHTALRSAPHTCPVPRCSLAGYSALCV